MTIREFCAFLFGLHVAGAILILKPPDPGNELARALFIFGLGLVWILLGRAVKRCGYC